MAAVSSKLLTAATADFTRSFTRCESATRGRRWDDDEDHGWRAIEFKNTEDAWVRNVTGKHFGFSLVDVAAGTRHITVAECLAFFFRCNGRRWRRSIGVGVHRVEKCRE